MSVLSLEQYRRTCYRKIDELTKRKPRPKHPLKVHVWAGVSRHGATKICIFDGSSLQKVQFGEEPESLEHLLSRCKVSSEFWKEVLSWLKEHNVVIESFGEIGLFLGIFEGVEDFLLINHVILSGKYYIYVRKCLGSLPSLRGFIARIRRVYNIELHIARERDKLATHFKKWEKLVAALNT